MAPVSACEVFGAITMKYLAKAAYVAMLEIAESLQVSLVC